MPLGRRNAGATTGSRVPPALPGTAGRHAARRIGIAFGGVQHLAEGVVRVLVVQESAPGKQFAQRLQSRGIESSHGYRRLTTVGDGTSFPTAAHLASYAGLAPTTKSSGTSIHGEHAPRGGNRQLKRAMFLSAFACMNADPASRTYSTSNETAAKPTPRPAAHCLVWAGVWRIRPTGEKPRART